MCDGKFFFGGGDTVYIVYFVLHLLFLGVRLFRCNKVDLLTLYTYLLTYLKLSAY